MARLSENPCSASFPTNAHTQQFVSLGGDSPLAAFSDQGSRACFFRFFFWFTRGGSARCTTLTHGLTDQAFARTLASCAWTWSVFSASWGTTSCDLLGTLDSGDKWAGWEGVARIVGLHAGWSSAYVHVRTVGVWGRGWCKHEARFLLVLSWLEWANVDV